MKMKLWLPMAAIGLLIVGCGSAKSEGSGYVADERSMEAKSKANNVKQLGVPSGGEFDDEIGYAGVPPDGGFSGTGGGGGTGGGSYRSNAALIDRAMIAGNYGTDQTLSVGTPPALTEMSTTSMAQQQRAIIRNGEISLRVEDVRASAREITTMVVIDGGYVESSKTSGVAGDNPTVDMTIRVVSKGFDDAMLTLEDMGILLGQSANTDDVTSQIVDLGARVKTLAAKEETFREMLRQSRNTSDIINLQERLTQVRTEIERMDAQRKSLSQLASLSSIRVHLTQNATMPIVAQDPNWFGENFASTSTSFMGSVKGVVSILMWVVIYAPFWGIPLFFSIWLWKKYGRPLGTTQTP